VQKGTTSFAINVVNVVTIWFSSVPFLESKFFTSLELVHHVIVFVACFLPQVGVFEGIGSRVLGGLFALRSHNF